MFYQASRSIMFSGNRQGLYVFTSNVCSDQMTVVWCLTVEVWLERVWNRQMVTSLCKLWFLCKKKRNGCDIYWCWHLLLDCHSRKFQKLIFLHSLNIVSHLINRNMYFLPVFLLLLLQVIQEWLWGQQQKNRAVSKRTWAPEKVSSLHLSLPYLTNLR